MICLSSLTCYLIFLGFSVLIVWLASRNISTGFKALEIGRKLGVAEEKSRQLEKISQRGRNG